MCANRMRRSPILRPGMKEPAELKDRFNAGPELAPLASPVGTQSCRRTLRARIECACDLVHEISTQGDQVSHGRFGLSAAVLRYAALLRNGMRLSATDGRGCVKTRQLSICAGRRSYKSLRYRASWENIFPSDSFRIGILRFSHLIEFSHSLGPDRTYASLPDAALRLSNCGRSCNTQHFHQGNGWVAGKPA
jgi:hypothetical protein